MGAFNPLPMFQSMIMTPQQQTSLQNQLVGSQIKAGIAGIQAASQVPIAMANQQAQRAQGFAQALAAATAPDPQAIANQYRQSAQFEQGLGTGLTGSLQQAQQQAADEAAQRTAAVGAPAAPAAGSAPGTGYDPASLRNTLQYGSVVLPSANLADQAANAFAQAQYGRAAGAANVGSIAQQYLQQVANLHLQNQAQIAQLQAQRPTLALQARAQIIGQQQQALSSLLQGQYLQNSLRQSGAMITGIDPYTGAPTMTTQLGMARIRNQAMTNQIRQMNSDRNYQLGLSRLGVSQGTLRIRAAQLQAKLGQSAANGGFTQSQVIQLQRRAGQLARDAFEGKRTSQVVAVQDRNGNPVYDKNNVQVTRTVPGLAKESYQQTIRNALSQGIPLTMIQKALNQYWQPGQHYGWEQQTEGRPWLSAQERKSLGISDKDAFKFKGNLLAGG